MNEKKLFPTDDAEIVKLNPGFPFYCSEHGFTKVTHWTQTGYILTCGCIEKIQTWHEIERSENRIAKLERGGVMSPQDERAILAAIK